jgi:superfamily II RNA helicase
MQDRAVEWGFRREDVGMVTGSRKVNPEAPVLVVVAEILLNRLLNRFDFSGVTACVMDEFHNFAEVERGIVWELSLGMLPSHVRLLLLSATVGNSAEFVNWLARQHDRKIAIVEGKERRIPLTYEWVPDLFLNEQLVVMAAGDEEGRRTPALVFCFDREECWSVAENVMGKDLNLSDAQKKELHDRVNALDLTRGPAPSSSGCSTGGSASIMPGCCRSTASPSRTSSSASSCPSSSAPRPWRPASTCRRARWCSRRW